MSSDNVKSFSPKEVYFLGAGTSAIVGIPTFENFDKIAEEICNKLSDDIPKKELFEKVLKNWHENFNGLNIEQYYAEIEIGEKVSGKKEGKEQKNINTKNIEDFISSTIQKSLKKTTHNSSYEEFFSRIGILRSAIITTNWDIVLETSSHFSLGGKWIYYEGVHPYEELESIKRDVQFHILKLHGSLNWGFCKKCNKIYYFEKMLDNTTLCDIKCRNGSCTNKLEVVMVPPTPSKLDNAPYLKYIWERAEDYLKSCRKLYFIGYSFPESDAQMKNFISMALRNSNLEEIIIVSNKKHLIAQIDFENRYLSSLPTHQSKMKFYYDGFEEFCKNISTYHPSEVGDIDAW